MAKPVNTILLVLVAVLLVPFASYAAGLGTFTVRSALGQPLDAEIEVVALQPGEELQVRLASRDAYGVAGVDFSPAMQGARFAIEKRDGKTVIRVRTTEPVNDPFLSVLVEVQLPSGRLARQYTVLVDPVEFRRAAAPAPAAPPIAAAPAPSIAPAPAPAVAPSIAAPAPARAPAQPVVATPSPTPAPAAPAVAVAPPAPSVPAVAIAPAPTPTASHVVVAPLQSPAPPTPPAAPALGATPIAVAAPAPASEPITAAPGPAPAQPAIVAAAPVEAPAPVVTPPATQQAVATPTLVQPAAQAPAPASITPAPAAPVVSTPAPATSQAAAAPVQPAPVSAAPQAQQAAVPRAPLVQPAPVESAPVAAIAPMQQASDASDTYRIRRGDTLGAIARKWKPEGVTHEQMLVGLYQTNRPVFIRDNINLIRAGATLFIPGREDVLAISAADAARQVRTHMAAFGRYRDTAVSVGLGSERITQAQREVISRRVGVKRSTRAM